MSTCWIINIRASGEFKAMGGGTGRLGSAAITTSAARPMRTRRGTMRMDSTGAVVNRPRMRKKGQIQALTQARIWASVKETMVPSKPTRSAHHRRDGLQHLLDVLDQGVEHPGAGDAQGGEGRQQL